MMKNDSRSPGAAPKVPLAPVYGKLGLLKYDCPTPGCSAWFVTFDPVDLLCKNCQETMVDTRVI